VRIALGSLLFPALLFLALPNWTRARRGYARTLASPGANSDRNDSRTAELTPSGHRRTTPRGSGQIVPSEFRTFRNRASTLFASRCGLSPSFQAAVLSQEDNVPFFVLLSLFLVSRITSSVILFRLFHSPVIC
jgi:hypothetical protein